MCALTQVFQECWSGLPPLLSSKMKIWTDLATWSGVPPPPKTNRCVPRGYCSFWLVVEWNIFHEKNLSWLVLLLETSVCDSVTKYVLECNSLDFHCVLNHSNNWRSKYMNSVKPSLTKTCFFRFYGFLHKICPTFGMAVPRRLVQLPLPRPAPGILDSVLPTWGEAGDRICYDAGIKDWRFHSFSNKSWKREILNQRWRIQRDARDPRPTSWSSFFHFHAFLGKTLANNRCYLQIQGLEPSRLGNPWFATD